MPLNKLQTMPTLINHLLSLLKRLSDQDIYQILHKIKNPQLSLGLILGWFLQMPYMKTLIYVRKRCMPLTHLPRLNPLNEPKPNDHHRPIRQNFQYFQLSYSILFGVL